MQKLPAIDSQELLRALKEDLDFTEMSEAVLNAGPLIHLAELEAA
jgi:hypothetical protein